MPRDLYHFPDFVVPYRMIIAPFQRQAELFIRDMMFYPPECKVIREARQIRGYRLDTWEVWWLDGMWPCRTHKDVQRIEELRALARAYGADLRHWWT